MRTRIKTIAVVVAITGGALGSLGPSALAGPGLTDDVSVQASCPDNGWSNKDPYTDRARTASNIRTGPSTACTSLGQAQASHTLDLHCWKSGQNGTWSHVRNTVTGRQGWVKDSTLVGGGAVNEC